MTRSNFCNDLNRLFTTLPMPNSFSLPANNTVSTLCSSGTSPDLKKLWHGISIFSKWRKCGPFYHISQLSKAFGNNNLVIILAGLVSVGTYIQYIGATFCRITWTRFLIQSFQTYLIHHSKIRKFDGNLQNTFRTFTQSTQTTRHKPTILTLVP